MECITPVYVRKTGITVRCGKCLPCLSVYQNFWSTRLKIEFESSITAYFVTLTYDDDHITDCDFGNYDDKNQYPLNIAMTLDDFSSMKPKLTKSHLTLFLKQLRNYISQGIPNHYKGKKVSQIESKGQNFKYFGVGEYGLKNQRPHWHILMLNYPFNLEDTENLISLAWKYGFDKIGLITAGAIEYTTDYMFKNVHNTVRMMSKGLGLSYFTEHKVRYHQKTLDGIVRLRNDTRNNPIPKYLSDKLFTKNQKRIMGEKKADFIMQKNLDDPYSRERELRQLKIKVEIKKRKKNE